MLRQLVRAAYAVCLLGALLSVVVSEVLAADREVVVLPTTGIVDTVMAGYLADGIDRAADQGAAAVVIELNTPGGSLSATNDIVGAILNAPLPVIVWVAPSGGFAASAGTFITLSANLAYMAPGTSIGAASPVGAGGEDITGVEAQKVKNDAIAKIRSIAEERHRPVSWAIAAVDSAKSSPASEAVAVGVVDGIASTIEDVVRMANGRQVEVRGTTLTLDLAGASPRQLGMNPFQAFLHLLSDPNIALLLFSVGSLGLTYELINPNFVTGIIGALAIILAFIGFGSLPLNVAGLLLIVFAIVLFILEATVTSHGLLGIGGIACFFLGASALYTEPGDPFEPAVRAAFPFVVTMTVTLAAFMFLVVVAAIRTRRMNVGRQIAGAQLVPGSAGVVRHPIEPLGSIYAAGEEWTARAVDNKPLPRGTPVKVVGVDGLTALVEPDQSSSQS